ncbi:hypothetical protein I551_7704 [Mycobacterium ulcerans str. Harvey]|uniref:Uncharacterized protein n=1 Tax=Mycobacterium ulcerans str. Harvey TaxID=1299332 RepID=A0ABN0QME7_MYCUL|nr:hypothetical protein I551_7704 [Mycobacterium ulcerans str. Harvey]
MVRYGSTCNNSIRGAGRLGRNHAGMAVVATTVIPRKKTRRRPATSLW